MNHINSNKIPSASFLIHISLGFFLFFRPQIIHPIFSSVLLVAFLGILYLLYKPKAINEIIGLLGIPAALSLLFIMIWSVIIDVHLGAIQILGLRSQFGASIRVIVQIAASFYFVKVCMKSDQDYFRKVIFGILFIQVVFAIAMFISMDFKDFIYRSISGYDGSEKMYRSHFIGSRIYGWSEELFYLAPVFMVFSFAIYFPKKISLLSIVSFFIVFIVAIFNARLAIVGLFFGLLVRFGIRKALSIGLFFIIFFMVLLLYLEHPAINMVTAEFETGGSRTLRILIDDHIHYLLNGAEIFFGNHYYLYGWPGRQFGSDIGWIIILNYGGYFYSLAWLIFVCSVCVRAFPVGSHSVYVFLLVVCVAVKGLAFSGNALIAFLLCLTFIGGYRPITCRSLKQ